MAVSIPHEEQNGDHSLPASREQQARNVLTVVLGESAYQAETDYAGDFFRDGEDTGDG